MFSDPIASLMSSESSRRALTAARRERQGQALPRRAAARLLQRAAHRLDPYVTGAPPVTVGR